MHLCKDSASLFIKLKIYNMTHTWSNLSIIWTKVLENDLKLESHYKIVPTEGYLAWEYNPLRNYRLSENMYEKDGKYYTK